MQHKILRELKAFVLRCSVNATYAARETSASTHQICIRLNTAFLKMFIANNYFISNCSEFVHNWHFTIKVQEEQGGRMTSRQNQVISFQFFFPTHIQQRGKS